MDQVKKCNGLYLLNEHRDYVLFPIILVHKAITQKSKLWPWKEWLKEHFESISFKFVCYCPQTRNHVHKHATKRTNKSLDYKQKQNVTHINKSWKMSHI